MKNRSQQTINLLIFFYAVLIGLLLIFSLLYIREVKQVEQTTVVFYNAEVESSLNIISAFLARVKEDSVVCEEEGFVGELELLFYQLDTGIMNITGEVGIKLKVPDKVVSQLKELRDVIRPYRESIYEGYIDRKAKQEIIDFTEHPG
ncbi:hypothetical protein [Litchfieldia alkalitelluris]|uniref:hypothetical protein n=1 Tax=Litchfieldia alkalitelluris TaxID=304268 RepID=UPI000996E58D|nr:hypothetical protein [Litchfieldia alkalitelluris]